MNKLLLLLMCWFVIPTTLYAQSCPENIGFENGNFGYWKLFTGAATLYSNKNTIITNEVSSPAANRHTLIKNNTDKDYYGGFELNPKNGGNYVVKLGNNGTGAQVDGVSYELTVPTDRPEFTLTYQYAVVLEDPSHPHEEQPRFIARVKDLETNTYIPCASFEYVATSSLPGFKKSRVDQTVIYKEWTPVTINLSGYQGKKLLIEFISADCALGGHFGYAYVDVNNLCGDLIVGNTFCKSADELNISGPSGFKQYNWYNADRSVKYGTGQSVVIKPSLPEGSKIILDLIPYEGFGCPSSVTTVVRSVDYVVQVLETKAVCENTVVDPTSSEFILNKTDGFTYLAFKDKDLTDPITGPSIVDRNMTVYIKATNFNGCDSYGTLDLKVFDFSAITIQNPSPVCYNETIDLTNDNLYSNVNGLNRTYYLDAAAKNTLTNASTINKSGIYYVMFTNTNGCSKTLPIIATINAKPALSIQSPQAVCFPNTVDIGAADVFKGNDPSLTYTFFEDQSLTKLIDDPKHISKSGIYYVLATNAQHCAVSNQIEVTINALPVLSIQNPAPICYPNKVDLTQMELYSGSSESLNYSFYTDATLTSKVPNPRAIAQSGSFYVKATNSSGCSVIGKIDVIINALPTIVVNKPKPIFDNSFVDLTAQEIIKGSANYIKVNYFYDARLTRPIDNPTKVNKAGTYYISLQNENGCSIAAPIHLEILPQPKIIVPTAFTPQKETNNRLYPFLVSVNKLTSFKIFNKWGILVYQTNEINAGWDGQFKSKMQPLETFSWFAEGIDSFGGKVQSTGKTILIL